MSKVSNMNMPEIFNQIDVIFDINDISKFCSNKDVRSRIIELIMAGKDPYEVIIDNEEYIDKEKLVLVSWLSYKRELEEKKKELSTVTIQSPQNKLNKAKLEQEIRDINNRLIRIKKISRDMDVFLVTVSNEGERVSEIKVISSKEEIQGYDFSEREKSNKELFDYIDTHLVTETDDLGMKYAVQTIEDEDFLRVMPYDIAQAIKYRMQKNTMFLGERYIQKFREAVQEDEEELDRISDECKEEVILPEVRSCIKETLRYVDLKKLLLLEIYRIEKNLNEVYSDNKKMSHERLQAAHTVANFLINVIEKDVKIEDENICYSYEAAQNFISRINLENNIYVTKEEEIKFKKELAQGLDLAETEEEKLEKICMLNFTKEELDYIMCKSKENFLFGMTMQDLSEDEIIEKAKQHKDKWSNELTEYFFSEGKLSIASILNLYYEGIISTEYLKKFSEENDISSEINLTKIQTLHSQIKKQKEPNEVEVKKINFMINLYKLIDFDSKEKESKEEIYREVIEIAEDDEDIVFYFEKGLLTLEIVAEWSGETAIGKLYDEAKITFEDIENLYKTGKISIDLLKSKFETEGLEYSALLSYIDLGYVSEDAIIDLYMKGKIFDLDFEDMFTKGTISIQKYLEATSKRTKEELEKNAKIKFKPTLVNIPNKKIRLETIEDDNDSGYPRWRYIK